jgi:hypothetical protein
MILADFTLLLDGKSFPVAKRNIIAFFELHPIIFDDTADQVRSRVSVEHFGEFVNYLNSKQLPEITTANAETFYSLSQEFGVVELSSRCRHFIPDLQTVDSPTRATGFGFNTICSSQAVEFESFRRDFPFCLADCLFSCLDHVICDFETR